MITSEYLRTAANNFIYPSDVVKLLEEAADTIEFLNQSNDRLLNENKALFNDIAFLQHSNLNNQRSMK